MMTHGFIIGKFLPPHEGHRYLVNFAQQWCDQVTVFVCSLKREPIPGSLRFKWMKELFPKVNVVHFTRELPQYPEEHPDFWALWCDNLLKYISNHCNNKPTHLFASENYGIRLADELDMEFIPVNISRDLVNVSGTSIRENPYANWDYIPSIVKPYFVKRIVIYGPESTGKTTLAQNLAKYYNTVWADEYARGLINIKGGPTYEMIEQIARGQLASENALAQIANKVLFSDTDLLTTMIWSQFFFGKYPSWFDDKARELKHDLYLVLDTDVPFVPDAQRYGGDRRQIETKDFIEKLEQFGYPYVLISGTWSERFNQAVEEIDKLF